MTLQEALQALAPLARAQGFEKQDFLQRLASEQSSRKVGRALGMVLGDAMVAGQLTTAVWREATSCSDPADFIAAMGCLMDDFIRAGLANSVDGFPQSWTQETLRLWGYTEGWLITSEDEDLALELDEFVPGLLELACDGACPKRDFALGIVRCWARKTASSAAGHEAFAPIVTRIAQYAVGARRANDPGLADYLLRLGSYATPGAVDRAGAYQRGLDLAGAHEPKPEDVKVEPDGDTWRLKIFAAKTIRIRKTDGRIF
jgi:hypothetical protein